MHAVVITEPANPMSCAGLRYPARSRPRRGPWSRVTAGVSTRADLMQREGRYPPPA